MKPVLFPNIPKKFERIPSGFVNDVKGWTFSKLEVETAFREKKLLTADVDISGAAACSLSCPNCFRRSAGFANETRLDFGRFEDVMRQAKALGLQSAKIIGPGEPLEEPELLRVLRLFVDLGIQPLIFTKGHPLADETICQRTHGIGTAELIVKLNEFNVSVLLGVTSFVPELEDWLVRHPGHHSLRSEALARLIKAGFNDFTPSQPTRLALCLAPILPENVDEAFEIYRWMRQRNIQPFLAPTMIAGRALAHLSKAIVDPAQLRALHIQINIWNIKHGLMTLEELEAQGISAYAGGAACNQLAVGLFLRSDGRVLRCPGDDISIQGDLNVQSLESIWLGSENFNKYGGQYNNRCPPKEGKSFPQDFFEDVMRAVKAHFGQA